MDQGASETLNERVAVLETTQRYERQMIDQRLSDLWLRLHKLERLPMKRHLSPEHLVPIKLALSLIIPLLVLLITGSPEKAETTHRLMHGQ